MSTLFQYFRRYSMKHEFDPLKGLLSLQMTYFCNFKTSKSKCIVMQLIKIVYLNNKTNFTKA